MPLCGSFDSIRYCRLRSSHYDFYYRIKVSTLHRERVCCSGRLLNMVNFEDSEYVHCRVMCFYAGSSVLWIPRPEALCRLYWLVKFLTALGNMDTNDPLLKQIRGPMPCVVKSAFTFIFIWVPSHVGITKNDNGNSDARTAEVRTEVDIFNITPADLKSCHISNI